MLYKLAAIIALAAGIAVEGANYAGPLTSDLAPHVSFHDGYYYVTGTARPDEGSIVMLHRAKTLQELNYSSNQAPELHVIDNKRYMYFSAVHKVIKKRRRCIETINYVIEIENTNPDPFAGIWKYKGQLKDPKNDFWAINATVFQRRGTNYVLYSGHADNDHILQRIYISKLQNPWTQEPGRVMITEPKLPFETNGHVNEGPEILMKNGMVFMVYSANGCWTNQYNLGMLWMNDSDDPMNVRSWHKLDHPLFTSNLAVGAFAPGHNSLFKSPNGKEDWIAYHAAATNHEQCGINRFVIAKKVNWKADDFPDFGTPIANGHLLPGPGGEPGLTTGTVLANGVYEIVNVESGRSLDVPNCCGESGAKLQQWDAYHNDCQKFAIHNFGGDYYSISVVSGGMLLATKDCKNEGQCLVLQVNWQGLPEMACG